MQVMITTAAKLSLYPYLTKAQVESKLPQFDIKDSDVSIYSKSEIELFEKTLIRDPVSGHVDNLVSYVLEHTGATAENVMKLIASVPHRNSPKLSDDELIEVLVPRSAQTAGELKQVQKYLEFYLGSMVAADKAEKAAAEKAAAEKAAAEKAAAEKAAAVKAAASGSEAASN